MKTLLFTMLLAASTAASAVEPDKIEHFTISAGVSLVATQLLEDTDHPILYGITVGLVPGAAKYIHDRHDAYFDAREKNHDMVANIIGATTGALVGHGLSLHLSHEFVGVRYNKNF